MRTNRLIFLIAIVVFALNCSKIKAQDWAPIGATWHYTKSYDIPPYLKSFIKVTSIKDTIINSTNCRMLFVYNPGITGTPNVYIDTLYMYDFNRKVYYYQKTLNRFCLLYDFNAKAGDWWILDEYSTLYQDTVKVLSTSTISINGQLRKTMNTTLISNNGSIGFGGLVIENIGNTYYMFPTFDMNFNGPLRCYQDNILGLYTTGVTSTCETTTMDINEVVSNVKVSIFPNPASEEVNVLYNVSGDVSSISIEITDITERNIGKYAAVKSNNSMKINTKSFKKGIYYVILVVDGKRSNVTKLVVL